MQSPDGTSIPGPWTLSVLAHFRDDPVIGLERREPPTHALVRGVYLGCAGRETVVVEFELIDSPPPPQKVAFCGVFEQHAFAAFEETPPELPWFVFEPALSIEQNIERLRGHVSDAIGVLGRREAMPLAAAEPAEDAMVGLSLGRLAAPPAPLAPHAGTSGAASPSAPSSPPKRPPSQHAPRRGKVVPAPEPPPPTPQFGGHRPSAPPPASSFGRTQPIAAPKGVVPPQPFPGDKRRPSSPPSVGRPAGRRPSAPPPAPPPPPPANRAVKRDEEG
jgi:hypothetical protein